ncbi:MAG: ATP-binding cassette domain-containing protein [Rikenellaceae bacterium]
MITAKNVCKSFDGRMVLDNVSANFVPGKTNLIIGRSGSGKTVLLKSLVGLLTIDSGEIMYGDMCFNKASLNEKRLMRQQLGMIFQGGALLDTATVEQNVRFPLDFFTDMTTEEKDERVNFCLNRVRLENANHLYPSELSGGMVKRTAIARAIVMRPKYLFCDEPNSGLDPSTSVIIDNLIREITQEYDITTIVNTHDMNSVMEIGDTVTFIYEGQKWWEGSKDDILSSSNKELDEFVFASAMARKVKSLSK